MHFRAMVWVATRIGRKSGNKCGKYITYFITNINAVTQLGYHTKCVEIYKLNSYVENKNNPY